MEKTVCTPAVKIVLTKPAIDFMEFVTLDVKVGIMDKNVNKVSIHEYSTAYCLYSENIHYRSVLSINLYQILEFPSTSSLSTVAAGFIGSSVSACVFIATAIVIFVKR